jgi:hypothetical protein
LDDCSGKREQEVGSDRRCSGKAARGRHAAQVPFEHEEGDSGSDPLDGQGHRGHFYVAFVDVDGGAVA